MKTILITCMIVISFFTSRAQDIIFKNDKSEIKVKIPEVQETEIKYKQFDLHNGPTSGINKKEVFMVIYSNGKRETFDREINAVKNTSESIQFSDMISDNNAIIDLNRIDNSENFNYSPIRLLVYSKGNKNAGGSKSIFAEASFEFRVLKNTHFLNFGLNSFNGTVEAENILGDTKVRSSANTTGIGLYSSGYLPVNLISKKFDKKNKGLFPFARIGFYYSYSSGYIEISNPYNYEHFSSDAVDIDYSVGLDYKFTKGFGLSVLVQQFKTIWYGLNLQF